MLGRVLDKELKRAREYEPVAAVLCNIHVHLKSFRETNLEKIGIQTCEDKFVAEFDELFIFALDHVPVDACQLMYV